MQIFGLPDPIKIRLLELFARKIHLSCPEYSALLSKPVLWVRCLLFQGRSQWPGEVRKELPLSVDYSQILSSGTSCTPLCNRWCWTKRTPSIVAIHQLDLSSSLPALAGWFMGHPLQAWASTNFHLSFADHSYCCIQGAGLAWQSSRPRASCTWVVACSWTQSHVSQGVGLTHSSWPIQSSLSQGWLAGYSACSELFGSRPQE